MGGGPGERSSPALPQTPLPTPYLEGLGEGLRACGL